MELLVKIVNDSKQEAVFAKKHHFRCVTGSDFVSDYNKSNNFYEQQVLYQGFFWKDNFYYLAEILLVKSQQ